MPHRDATCDGRKSSSADTSKTSWTGCWVFFLQADKTILQCTKKKILRWNDKRMKVTGRNQVTNGSGTGKIFDIWGEPSNTPGREHEVESGATQTEGCRTWELARNSEVMGRSSYRQKKKKKRKREKNKRLKRSPSRNWEVESQRGLFLKEAAHDVPPISSNKPSAGARWGHRDAVSVHREETPPSCQT